MKHPVQILSLSSVVLVAILLVAGCTSVSPGSQPNPTLVPTVVTPSQSSCGFASCHGLDLACGTDAPDVCTMEYRLGDKCRQYVQCTAGSSGSCTLVAGPQFNTCKSCVESCADTSVNNPQQAFACEAKC